MEESDTPPIYCIRAVEIKTVSRIDKPTAQLYINNHITANIGKVVVVVVVTVVVVVIVMDIIIIVIARRREDVEA
jgi:cell division protein FtsX